MLRRLLLGATALLLCACAAQERVGEGERIQVVWQRVDDPQKACEGVSGRREVFRVLGCSKWTEPTASAPRTCTVYVPQPRDERDTQRFATLGHELMHCFDGNWHDRWGRMHPPERQAAAQSGTTANRHSE